MKLFLVSTNIFMFLLGFAFSTSSSVWWSQVSLGTSFRIISDTLGFFRNDTEDVFVGRIRSQTINSENWTSMWIVADNVYGKGAALNTVQILESLVENNKLCWDIYCYYHWYSA